MTTPTGPILFNNSTGSDSAASGLGPATAVTGTGASLNATSTVDVSADSPDLSGVTAGHLLWVLTSSGRQFSVIASVDNAAKTITCDDAFAVTESSRTWAVGGKRSGLTDANSRALFGSTNAKTGWEINFEYTGTAYTYSASLTVSPSNVGGVLLIKGTGAGEVVLDFDYMFEAIIGVGWVRLENLTIQRSRVASDYVAPTIKTYGDWTLTDCKLIHINGQVRGPGASGIEFNSNRRYFIRCVRVRFENCDEGVFKNSGSEDAMVHLQDCSFINNRYAVYAYGKNFSIQGCLFQGNTTAAIIMLSLSDSFVVTGNIFYGANETVSFPSGESSYGTLSHNVFSGVTGTAVTFGDTTRALSVENAFYDCGTNYSGSFVGADDISLSSDPFVDAASDDFNLNTTSGGGAELRSTSNAMPGLADTAYYPYRRWVSDDFGGGSVIVVEDD